MAAARLSITRLEYSGAFTRLGKSGDLDSSGIRFIEAEQAIETTNKPTDQRPARVWGKNFT